MSALATVRYLTHSELIFINGALLQNAQLMSGKQKVRDLDLLLAAVQRPQASAFGADAYPTLREKAAVLLHAIARNHPFADGNKRTATIGAVLMLEVNGQTPVWNAPDALRWILDVAEGRQSWQALAAWLPLAACEARLAADEARDIAHIYALLETHRWLLHELETR